MELGQFLLQAYVVRCRFVACRPDILHCHDWPSAPVCYGDKGPSKSIFTIHNLNFGADLIGRAMQAAQVTCMHTFVSDNHGLLLH